MNKKSIAPILLIDTSWALVAPLLLTQNFCQKFNETASKCDSNLSASSKAQYLGVTEGKRIGKKEKTKGVLIRNLEAN